MKKIKKYTVFLIPILVFILIWGCSLIKCELQTMMYKNEFEKVINMDKSIGDIDYYKIISYSKESSSVYCVINNYKIGNVLKFIKENGEWKISTWDTIWSKTGSADDTIWPYWWHFFYSH